MKKWKCLVGCMFGDAWGVRTHLCDCVCLFPSPTLIGLSEWQKEAERLLEISEILTCCRSYATSLMSCVLCHETLTVNDLRESQSVDYKCEQSEGLLPPVRRRVTVANIRVSACETSPIRERAKAEAYVTYTLLWIQQEAKGDGVVRLRSMFVVGLHAILGGQHSLQFIECKIWKSHKRQFCIYNQCEKRQVSMLCCAT